MNNENYLFFAKNEFFSIEESAMVIQIETLSVGIYHYEFVVRPEDVYLDELNERSERINEVLKGFLFPITVNANVEKSERQVLLRASVDTKQETICDRCTETFNQNVRGEYETIYVYDDKHGAISPDEDFVLLPRDNPIIDLTDDVRQTVLLSVPMKILCREDCLGLCSQCGSNLNLGVCDCEKEVLDERWKKLMSLKN